MLLSTPRLTLEYNSPIYLVTLLEPENRFSLEMIKDLNSCLDLVKSNRIFNLPQCLVISNSNKKIFSNGLLLNLLATHGPIYFKQFQILLANLLLFPIPTIAVIHGHAFAGGFMFAMAFDYRVMNSDRGFCCLNEVDMPAPLTPGMHAIIQSKITDGQVIRNIFLKGHRFTGLECLKYGIVDYAVAADKIQETANELALLVAPKAAHSGVGAQCYHWLKHGMYRNTVDILLAGNLGSVAKFIGLDEVDDILKSKL